MTHALRKSPLRGTTYALAGALLFGVNGSVAKVVIGVGVTPAQLTFMRSFAAALIAGAVLLFTARQHFRLSGKEVGSFALLGILGVAIIQWLYAVAISRLPVGVALLIEYTAVILVALAAWIIFREKVHGRLWLAIAAVIVGLAIVAQVWDSHLDALGAIAATGAALAYAFYFLAGERGVARRPPMAVAFWSTLFAAAFWSLFSQWWLIDPALFTEPVSLTGALDAIVVPVWLPLAWVLTLGSFAPFVLSFAALRHLSATAVGILASSEVLFAFIVAWAWLGETLVAVQIAGAALVLGGIVLAQTARERRPDAAVTSAAEVPTELP